MLHTHEASDGDGGRIPERVLTTAARLFSELGEFVARHPAYSALLDLPGDAAWRRDTRVRRRQQIAALFSGAFMRFLGKFRVHLGRVEKAIGVLLVVAGVFFLTGGVQTVSYWLLENFPLLGQLG